MNRFGVFDVVLAAFGCAALSLTAGAANLMQGGDFEKWNDAKGQPAGADWRWGFSQKGTNGFAVCELSEAERHGGRASLHLKDANAGSFNHTMWYQFSKEELKAMSSKTVRASAWIKQVSASNPPFVGIALMATGEDGKSVDRHNGTGTPGATDWVNVQVKVKMPDNNDSLAWVRDHSAVPIAAGERFYGLYAWNDVLRRNCVDIAQPDIFHNMGLLTSKKVAAMCEANHVPVSFHNPSGPISNAAILQLAATTPNFVIHEMMLTDGSFRKVVTNENVKFEDGYLVISDKPGLGIDVNVEEIEKRPYTPRNLRHYTGTLTDIRPKGDSFYFFEGLDCEHPVF